MSSVYNACTGLPNVKLLTDLLLPTPEKNTRNKKTNIRIIDSLCRTARCGSRWVGLQHHSVKSNGQPRFGPLACVFETH